MVQLTNNENNSIPLAVWLAFDDYDYDSDPNTISTTSLIKSTRKLILGQRAKAQGNVSLDIADLIASTYGTAVHDSVEKAWKKGYRKALKALGFPDKVIDRVKINPTPEELTEDTIPIYVEQRAHRKVGEYTISGKYDMVFEGRVNDIKTTSAFSYMMGNKDTDYILQGSIYRWLNPEIITDDYMNIQYVFTDWSKLNSMKESHKGYPQSRVLEHKLPLMSLEETEQYIKSRLAEIDKYKDAEESMLPECSEDDLWVGPSVWKYYKNPNNTTRSTRNFNTATEAQNYKREKGNVGIVVEVKSDVKACKYCPAFDLCSQKDRLIAEGRLVIQELL